MTARAVFAIGIGPALLDFSGHPQLTSELVRSYIDAELQRLREQGYDVTSCLIDLGETAEQVAAAALASGNFDCVVIGAGLRVPPERTLLFEGSQSGSPARPACQHLLQHHPGRHRRGGAALDRSLKRDGFVTARKSDAPAQSRVHACRHWHKTAPARIYAAWPHEYRANGAAAARCSARRLRQPAYSNR
jgi:hypothetical protein